MTTTGRLPSPGIPGWVNRPLWELSEHSIVGSAAGPPGLPAYPVCSPQGIFQDGHCCSAYKTPAYPTVTQNAQFCFLCWESITSGNLAQKSEALWRETDGCKARRVEDESATGCVSYNPVWRCGFRLPERCADRLCWCMGNELVTSLSMASKSFWGPGVLVEASFKEEYVERALDSGVRGPCPCSATESLTSPLPTLLSTSWKWRIISEG